MEPVPDLLTLAESRLGFTRHVRELVQAERAAWAHVPWVVALANALPDGCPELVFDRLDPCVPVHVTIDQLRLDAARRGRWPVFGYSGDDVVISVVLDSGEFENAARNSYTGEWSTGRASVEHLWMAFGQPNLFDPTPLLEREGEFVELANGSEFAQIISKFQITPIYAPREARSAYDAALLGLAADWSGSVPELLAAAEMLVAS